MFLGSQTCRALDFSIFQRFTLTHVSRLWCTHHPSTIKNQKIFLILSRLMWLDSRPCERRFLIFIEGIRNPGQHHLKCEESMQLCRPLGQSRGDVL